MPLPNINYAAGQDNLSDVYDKINAAIDAINEFAAGSTGEIWTKDSSSEFDGSFKSAQTVVNSGLPSRSGKANYIVKVKNDESGFELYEVHSDFLAIPIVGSGYNTISSSSYATLTDSLSTSLSLTLPNDSIDRKFMIIGKAAYENSASETSIIMTRIYDGTTTLNEDVTDIRDGDQDDEVVLWNGTLTCVGQIISLQAKKSSGDAFEFNGGNISIIEIL